MKLTITTDRKEESESVVWVPKNCYLNVMALLDDWGVFPTPRRTTTVGAEPDTCPPDDCQYQFTEVCIDCEWFVECNDGGQV